MVWAEFWPTADQDPAATPGVVEFAQIWPDMPKVVYSQTQQRADWNATVVHDVVPAEVLVLGGADLAAEFARHGLIDEYRLYVHPMVIVRGTPMLRRSDAKVPLRLIETHNFGNGVVMLRYERPPLEPPHPFSKVHRTSARPVLSQPFQRARNRRWRATIRVRIETVSSRRNAPASASPTAHRLASDSSRVLKKIPTHHLQAEPCGIGVAGGALLN
jgi:hypothetical protein